MPVRTGWEVVVIPNPAIVAHAFFDAAEHAKTLRKPMTEIVKRASEEIAQNFAVEGRPQKWKSLAEATIANRTSEGYPARPILDRTGALKEAATSPDSWQITTGGQATVAALQVPGYERFHITGAPNNNMPQRDWSYLDPAFDEYADQVLADWVF